MTYMTYKLYIDVAVADVHSALNQLSDWVSDVKDWCLSLRLQLDDAKTCIAWCGSHVNLIKLAYVDCSLSIGDVAVKPSTMVRDVGVLLDSALTLKQHISKVTSCCYHHIKRLREVSRFISSDEANLCIHTIQARPLQHHTGRSAEVINSHTATRTECCCLPGAWSGPMRPHRWWIAPGKLASSWGPYPIKAVSWCIWRTLDVVTANNKMRV